MAIHLNVRHPSPVSAIPRRGRKERHGFEALSTAVAIREVDHAAFQPMPAIEMGLVAVYGLFRHDGATWSELAPNQGGPGFATADVLAFMRDGTLEDVDTLDAMRARLRFTPVHAGTLAISGSHTKEVSLSLDDPEIHLDGPNLDRVTHEERERSSASLGAWLERNVAIAGDRVMIRTPVMLEVMEWAGRLNVYSTTLMSVSRHDIRGIRPDRARDLCASIGKPFDDSDMEEGLGRFEEWAEGLSTDDDVLMLANRLPALVGTMADEAAREPGNRRRAQGPAAAADALDGIRPWRLRGAVGGIALDEVSMVLQACRKAIEGLEAAGVRLYSDPAGPRGILQVAHDKYVARIDEIAPEDAEALAMMG